MCSVNNALDIYIYIGVLTRAAEEAEAVEAVESAVEEAVETTEQRMAKLNQILLRDKRYEELEKISVDADYRKKLMEDYNI